MKTIDFSYFIERYNADEMSEAEKEWFLKELDGNESLKYEIRIRKQADDVLKDQATISLRNKLSKIEEQRRTVVPEKKPGNRAYYKYAAVLAIFIIIGGIAMFSGKELSSDVILERYYKPYEAPANQRSVRSDTNDDFALALEFYNSHDYEKAASLFSKVLETNPKDMQSVLLKGVSNFEEQKYPDAKDSFSKVIDDNNNLFIETAKWYLALCYVKTNDNERAMAYLATISNEGGIYAKDARKIARKLK